MGLNRAAALVFAVTFAVVGAIFLLAPGIVSSLFEWIGRETGTPGMPAGDTESGLFRALAVAYMYVVTVLAWMMFRRPAEPVWPTLLGHAKLASAALSIILFFTHGRYLAYAANGAVDALIGATALVLRDRMVRRAGATGPVRGGR